MGMLLAKNPEMYGGEVWKLIFGLEDDIFDTLVKK